MRVNKKFDGLAGGEQPVRGALRDRHEVSDSGRARRSDVDDELTVGILQYLSAQVTDHDGIPFSGKTVSTFRGNVHAAFARDALRRDSQRLGQG